MKSILLIFGTKNMSLEIKEMACEFYQDTFDAVKTVYFSEDFVKENGLEEKINSGEKIYYIVGFGGTNRKLCVDFVKNFSNFVPFTIIHPTASVSKSAKIGSGSLIMANATVSTNAILGEHCVVNYNASVGHDSKLSDNIFIQPGARVSGNCEIGEGTLIGSNSFVYQNLKVGRECLVDALTYIHENVADRMVVSSRYKEAVSRDVLTKDNKLPMWN